MGKNKSKKNKKAKPEYVELEEINIITRIPSKAARITITAEFIDEESGELRKCHKRLCADEIRKARQDFLDNVEAHYSLKPVIYTTEKWLPVVQERFANYDIWIRSVYKKPNPSLDWTFWQYSNRHVLQGYSGDERYIDMNAFKGTIEEFNKYYR